MPPPRRPRLSSWESWAFTSLARNAVNVLLEVDETLLAAVDPVHQRAERNGVLAAPAADGYGNPPPPETSPID